MGGLNRVQGGPVVRAREVLRGAGALGDRGRMVPAHLHCHSPRLTGSVEPREWQPAELPCECSTNRLGMGISRRTHVVEGSQAAVSAASYQHRHAGALSSYVGARRLHAR